MSRYVRKKDEYVLMRPALQKGEKKDAKRDYHIIPIIDGRIADTSICGLTPVGGWSKPVKLVKNEKHVDCKECLIGARRLSIEMKKT